MDIIIGEKVINKIMEVGIITSFDDKFIYVEYKTRTGKLQLDAFEQGFIKYENAELQNQVNKAIELKANEKKQGIEARNATYIKTEAVRREIESKSPIGVRVDAAQIRLEPAPVSLSSVKSKDKKLLQEIFTDCDNTIKAHYDAFDHQIKYLRIPFYASSATSRYCVGYLSKYSNAYVLRVFSRNDLYEEGRVGNVVVKQSDTTEIIRIVCVEDRVYYFSKNLSCAGASAKNSELYKKWQASNFAEFVKLNKIVRNCDCKYLNDYIEIKDVNCLQYFKVLIAALHNNKAEIVFKNRSFSSMAHIDNIIEYLEEFNSKQIDFASKNNVINTLPIIKRYGLYDIEILKKLESLMRIRKNGDSIYTSLKQIFNRFNFDLSDLDTRLINFLRRTDIFNANLYGDYINMLVQVPVITVDDLFDRDYIDRHNALMLESNTYFSARDNEEYIQEAKRLSWINREENGFFIIIPQTIEDFKYEGRLQHNCVYTNKYFYNVIDRCSIIVFLRKEKDVPYVTIEYDYETFEVLQAFGKYNSWIDDDLYQYIKDLGKTLHEEMISQE